MEFSGNYLRHFGSQKEKIARSVYKKRAESTGVNFDDLEGGCFVGFFYNKCKYRKQLPKSLIFSEHRLSFA